MQKRGITASVAALLVAGIFIGVFPSFSRVKRPAQPPPIGIGAVVVPVKSTFQIIGVVPGTPAEKAGLRPGMVIEEINGTNVMGAPLSMCVTMMRGPVGSKVQLKVVDTARRQTNVVECSRARIAMPGDEDAAVVPPAAPK